MTKYCGNETCAYVGACLHPKGCSVTYSKAERATLKLKTLSDKDLVEKIERGNVLLAEDLNELIERFKAYSKLT